MSDDGKKNMQIGEWAGRQLADFDAREPGGIFGEGVELSVAEGYALQGAVAKLRCDRGEKVVGYKVGCTSAAIRKQLGIDHCVTGRLWDTEQYESGAVLSRGGFANLAIEGELAVELARDVVAVDFEGEGIPECVGRVFPVIELHHHVLRGERAKAGELIGHNAIHAGVVAGEGVKREEVEVGIEGLRIYKDDELIEECGGAVLIETIRESLKWLRGVVEERGEKLEAGQIILTGSVPRLIGIGEDCCVRVEVGLAGSEGVAGVMGVVEVEFGG